MNQSDKKPIWKTTPEKINFNSSSVKEFGLKKIHTSRPEKGAKFALENKKLSMAQKLTQS